MQRCYRHICKKTFKVSTFFRVSAWCLTSERWHNIHQRNHNLSVWVCNGPLTSVMTSSLWEQVARGEHPWRQSHPESWLNTGPGRLGTRPLEIFPECHSVSSDLGYKSDLCPFYILPSKDFKHSMSPLKANAATTHCISREKKKSWQCLQFISSAPRQNPCEGVSRQTDECHENVICQIAQHLWSQRSQLMAHLWGWQELEALSTVSVHKSSCYCPEYKVLHVLWLQKKRRKKLHTIKKKSLLPLHTEWPKLCIVVLWEKGGPDKFNFHPA